MSYWQAVASSADGTRLLAGGEPFSFYTSTNGGGTWTMSYAGDFGEAMTSIASSADGTKLFAGGCVCGIAQHGRIYTSTNSGATWSPTSLFVYNPSIAVSADGAKVVVAETGTVYISIDSGATWATNQLGLAVRPAASSADGSRLVVGDHISTNFGASWTPSGAPEDWVSIASSADGTKLVAAGTRGGIYTWQSMPAPVLHIASVNTSLVLSWIVPRIDFVLQENSDLSTNWTDVTNRPALNFTNLQYQVLVPTSAGNRFYRLKH
jgi:photosystem II stability/assembly factor-like uncharacterized protein